MSVIYENNDKLPPRNLPPTLLRTFSTEHTTFATGLLVQIIM
jgi:hypothetical protein